MGDDQQPKERYMKELVDMRQQVAEYSASTAGNGAGDHHDYPGRLQHLQAVLDAVTDGAFEWDLATNWLDWDDRLHSLVGTSSNGFSHHISEFIDRVHVDDIGCATAFFDARSQPDEPYRAEFRLRLADGDFSRASLIGKVLRDADGSAVKLVGALTFTNDDRGVAQKPGGWQSREFSCRYSR